MEKLNIVQAALNWFAFGLKVIPVIQNTKQTAVKWDGWQENLSLPKICAHWKRYPKHELGFIVGDDVIVLDADSPESVAALVEIEWALDVACNLIVTTKKGVHHYFRLAAGTFAKTDSHATALHPARIDVKAKRSMVILPPSTGKEIEIIEAENICELTEVGQAFIDAIARHNGRNAPRAIEAAPATSNTPSSTTILHLNALLAYLDADCSYGEWVRVLMAIFNTTGGSEEGFEMANAWSSTGGNQYKGENSIRAQWRSFKLDVPNPITLGTIIKMVKDAGYDWKEICLDAEGEFEILADCEGA